MVKVRITTVNTAGNQYLCTQQENTTGTLASEPGDIRKNKSLETVQSRTFTTDEETEAPWLGRHIEGPQNLSHTIYAYLQKDSDFCETFSRSVALFTNSFGLKRVGAGD